MGKQAYKLELPKKWRIYDVFHVSLLEQNITRKEQVDENVTEFETGSNDEEYIFSPFIVFLNLLLYLFFSISSPPNVVRSQYFILLVYGGVHGRIYGR